MTLSYFGVNAINRHPYSIATQVWVMLPTY